MFYIWNIKSDSMEKCKTKKKGKKWMRTQKHVENPREGAGHLGGLRETVISAWRQVRVQGWMGTKRPLFLNSPGSDLSNSLHLSGEDRMFLHSNKFHGVKISSNDIHKWHSYRNMFSNKGHFTGSGHLKLLVAKKYWTSVHMLLKLWEHFEKPGTGRGNTEDLCSLQSCITVFCCIFRDSGINSCSWQMCEISESWKQWISSSSITAITKA